VQHANYFNPITKDTVENKVLLKVLHKSHPHAFKARILKLPFNPCTRHLRQLLETRRTRIEKSVSRR